MPGPEVSPPPAESAGQAFAQAAAVHALTEPWSLLKMYRVWPLGPIRNIPCAPLARLTVSPVDVAGPIVLSAVTGLVVDVLATGGGVVVDAGLDDVLADVVVVLVAVDDEEPQAATLRAATSTPAAPRPRRSTRVPVPIMILTGGRPPAQPTFATLNPPTPLPLTLVPWSLTNV